jgi:hypothetical protein
VLDLLDGGPAAPKAPFPLNPSQILGKACNNIPEAVNKLAVSAAWTILVKLGEINMTPLIILNKTQSFITG